MVRVLKPGGRIVVIVQNTLHPLRSLNSKLGWQGFTQQPTVRPISATDLRQRFERLGLLDIQIDGIEPWKGVFHGIPVLTSTRTAHNLTYLVYRALGRLVPLPRSMRSRLAVQFIVAGSKRP